MKRTCVLLALTALLIGLALLAGCARKPAASPNSTIAPPSGKGKIDFEKEFGPTKQQLIAWQQSLSPEDRKTLDSTGKLVIPYATLKTADPARVKIVDEFLRQQIRLMNAAANGNPTPDLGAPDKVTFTKESAGQYTFMLDTTGGASLRMGLAPAETGQPGK